MSKIKEELITVLISGIMSAPFCHISGALCASEAAGFHLRTGFDQPTRELLLMGGILKREHKVLLGCIFQFCMA